MSEDLIRNIQVHQPDGSIIPFEVSRHYSDEVVLSSLSNLLRSDDQIPAAQVGGTVFRHRRLQVSTASHLFVVRLGRSAHLSSFPPVSSDHGADLMDVFAIEGLDNRNSNLNEVFERVSFTYQNEFVPGDKDSLTAYYRSNDENNTDDGYACGSIFVIRSADSSSQSDSDDSISNYRYLVDSFFAPKPLIPLGFSPTESESDSDNKESSVRKGITAEGEVDVLLQDQPQVDQMKFAQSMGYTGELPVLNITSEVIRNSSEDTIKNELPKTAPPSPPPPSPPPLDAALLSPFEESSSSSCASEHHGSLSEKPADEKKESSNSPKVVGNEVMVVGCIPRAASFDTPPTLVGVDSTARVQRNNLELPPPSGRPPYMRSISSPPTPSPVHDTARPLTSQDRRPGIQRQNSGTENEMVVGFGDRHVTKRTVQLPSPLNMAVVPCKNAMPVKEPCVPSSSGHGSVRRGEEVPAVEVEDRMVGGGGGCGMTEGGGKIQRRGSCGLLVGGEERLPHVGDKAGHNVVFSIGGKEVEGEDDDDVEMGNMAVTTENESENVSPDGSSYTTIITTTSEGSAVTSLVDELTLQQVQLLEHACNNTCHLMESCRHEDDPDFEENLEQMKSLLKADVLAGDMKRYIRIHCHDYCRGKGCKVPHMAAGCSLPMETSPICSPSHRPVVGLDYTSMDQVAAFDSRTPPSHHQQMVPQRPKNLPQPQPPPPLPIQQQATPLQHHQYHTRHIAAPYEDGGFGTAAYVSHDVKASDIPSPPLAQTRQARQELGDHLHSSHLPPPAHKRSHPLSHKPAHNEEPYYVYQGPPERRHKQFEEDERLQVVPDVQPVPDVSKEGFPELLTYKANSLPNCTIIYSKENQQFVVGLTLPPIRYDDRLGKGGNGTVVKHCLLNKKYAVKRTNYRRKELNAWRRLDHPNVIPLLAVVLEQSGRCLQFMPCMTDNLRSMMRKIGILKNLLRGEAPEIWAVIMSNVCYILTEVLKALHYFASLNLQHCDVKASNILVHKTCSCQDILHCTCSGEDKYSVKLADFDSVKERRTVPRGAQDIPNVKCVRKTPEQVKRVMGTPPYRAPEKFLCPEAKDAAAATAVVAGGGGENTMDTLEGPWCDMWSLGMVVLRLILGDDTKEDICQANTLAGEPHLEKLTPSSEAIHAKEKLIHALAEEDSSLRALAMLAYKCLQADFRSRPTAEELLIDVNKLMHR